ncbi:MAG: ABC transporter ATP-binding protein [Acetobacteraceae bacterium]|nr:ABC transporter ATP-binding protein [Acetobacteraceae bacterium]
MVGVLEVRHLTMVYPGRARGREKEGHRALSDVSFEARAGEVFGILGPNGAGKTTLMKILANLIIPTSGEVLIAGRRLHPRAQARWVGLSTGEDRSFYYRLSGWQNLEFFGSLRSLGRARLRQRIEWCLEAVGLEGASHVKFMKYSTGMRKRLNIARALLHDPPILLLDEPTASLDPVSARRVRDLIRDLKGQGKTILMATHNLAEAESACDRVGILSSGRLLAVGTPQGLRAMAAGRSVWLRPAERLDALAEAELLALPGVRQVRRWDSQVILDTGEVRATLDGLVRWAAQGHSLCDIRVVEPALEDVFLRLVAEAASEPAGPSHPAGQKGVRA